MMTADELCYGCTIGTDKHSVKQLKTGKIVIKSIFSGQKKAPVIRKNRKTDAGLLCNPCINSEMGDRSH